MVKEPSGHGPTAARQPPLLATVIVMAPAPQLQLTPKEDNKFVIDRIPDGADYIKDHGRRGQHPRKSRATTAQQRDTHPCCRRSPLPQQVDGYSCSSRRGSKAAIAVGVDGLAHLWIDHPDSELVAAIAVSGSFVTPYPFFYSSIMGNTGASSAADSRVASKLGSE